MISVKVRKGVFILTALLLGVSYPASASAKKSPFPWKFGGYEKIDALHLKYWSAAKDAFGDAQNFTKPDFPTEISEVWFSKSSQGLRVDKYVEKSTVRCNQFKGKEGETITENGIEYILQQRVIQTGTTRSQRYLSNIMSGGGAELCEYKSSEGPRAAGTSVRDALSILTMRPYLANPDYEEMAVSSLELDEVMDPANYKATLQEFKKTYDKAGRKTAKYETNHGIINFMAQGPVYIDLEWGMALEGYIAKISTGGKPPLVFPEPVCVYKVLSVETGIADPAVFK